MLDRLFAFVSLALVVMFCGLLVTYVNRIDLAVVVIFCLLLAAYDLLYYSFKPNRGNTRDGPREG